MSNRIRILDFGSPELDCYVRKNENQLLCRESPEKGMFLAESLNVIERALDAGCVPASFLVEEEQLGKAEAVLQRCPQVPVYVAGTALFRELRGFGMTRGVLCAMYRPAKKSAAEICAASRRIAVLENVVNPTNVGAIFRSAAALGMDGLLLTSDCSDPLYRRAIRVSMGTVFQIPWAYLDAGCGAWPDLGMDFLHGQGFRTAAMALCGDSVRADDARLLAEERLAVILGTEGYGLSEKTIAKSDYTVRIPMSHGVDSLNVAAASAVIFWELSKRR